MNKKGISVAVVAVFAAVSGAQAAGTMTGLSGAGEKIAAVDMKKDFNKAGGVLNDFFTGSLTKKTDTSEGTAAVSAAKVSAGPARNIYGQTADQLVNAKASKIGRLSSEVKPLAGKTAFAAVGGEKKSTWWEDAQTVGSYVGGVAGAAYDTGNAYVHNDVIGVVQGAYHTYQHATCTD